MSIQQQFLDQRTPEFLKGYEKANEYFIAERIAFLNRLTLQESLAIFNSLWHVGENFECPKRNLDALEKRKITELINRRRAIDQIASLGNQE